MKRLTRSLATGLLACAPLSSALAGSYNPTASDSMSNTAGGNSSQPSSSTVYGNTGFGFASLNSNTGGNSNTALGAWTMTYNSTGTTNTGLGYAVMTSNTAGNQNVGIGGFAAQYNTTGVDNTAVGAYALQSNNGGASNVAIGHQALAREPYAQGNIAIGEQALYTASNTVAAIAIGTNALFSNQSSGNIGIGSQALQNATTGAYNVAIGFDSGFNITTGGFNIDLGNAGSASDANTIRIGNGNQTQTYVAGIYGATLTGGGSTVIINSNGQLGTVVSSARYKKDVTDMGTQSDALLQLRPVTFHYKSDAAQETQYGLIAEEVAAVYPELVVRNDKGEVESVRYYELAPMLLNEVKKQRAQIDALTARLDALEAKGRD